VNNFRSLMLLSAAIALAVLALWTGRSSDEAIQVSGREVLNGLTVDCTGITLERTGSPRVRLAKDGRWKLCEPYSAQADDQRVMKLMDSFSQAPILDYIAEDELTRRDQTTADFSLENPVMKVAFELPNGPRSVSFGMPTPAADGVYAIIDDVPGVFVMRSEVLSAVDLPVDDLRRRSLFLSGPESVSAFDIRRGSGSRLEFVRTGDGWRIGGERASEASVRKFLSALTSANAVDFIWPTGAEKESAESSSALLSGYGLEPESALTVTLKGVDGADRTISLGKSAGSSSVYALVQNGSSIVTVSSTLRELAGQDVRLFTDSRLFPVEAASVAYFTVTDGDTSYALARSEQGAWRLESPVSAPADTAAVEALLGRILNLSPADADAGGLAVSLTTNAPALYISRNRLMDAMGFDCLRSREVLKLDPAKVRRLVRIAGDRKEHPISVVYGRDRRAWNLERMDGDGRVSESGIGTILSALNPLVAERVERLKVSSSDLDDYGLNDPYLTLAIDQEGADSVRRNLLIGGRTDGGRFATIGSSDAVFVLGDAVVEKLETPPAD